MSRVYLAYDHRLRQSVALKRPRDAGPRPTWEVRARLLREALALDRCRHRGVVTLLDVCVDDGDVGLVLDVVDGAQLRDQVLPWRRAAAIFAGVGDALAAVHAAGVVHRDVSPQNILLGPDDRATLIDFGLARAWHPRDPDGADDLLALRLSASASGTPAFMAPEQQRGAPPDPAADQYGLCASLFACLVGEPPGDAPAADRLDAWSRRAAPEELWRVIGRGLSAADRRFADARELADRLADLAARPRSHE